MEVFYQLEQEYLRKILQECLVKDSFKVIFNTTNQWSKPLPKDLTTNTRMLLELKGWALEETKLEGSILKLKVAFGEVENTLNLPLWDIESIGINKRVIYTRHNLKPQKEYTLKGLMR
jgi:hypothetical protein